MENIVKVDPLKNLPVDPPLAGQNYGLFSFKLFPKPVDGVYGFLKFRGAFNTEDDFMRHSKYIIQSVDSKHKIFPYPQGHWFPITIEERFAKETVEVSDKDTLSNIYNEKEKDEANKQREAMKSIEDRRKMLMEESKREKPDTESLRYYAEKVMQVEQINDWLENLRKRKRDLTNALAKSKEEIDRLNMEHPEYKEKVKEEIDGIRQEIGL
jgi:vacuolar-type H+-ATPase subunit I/STV1